MAEHSVRRLRWGCRVLRMLRRDRERKHEGITEIVKPFDWSYTTDYKGTVHQSAPAFEPSLSGIPLELLRRPDPILFFDEVMLYEDEMADNGITVFSCKIRVMPGRLLLLCRFFMRLDNVLIRLRDTRIYVEFISREIIRHYVAKEEKYEIVRQVNNQTQIGSLGWLCTDTARRNSREVAKMSQRNYGIRTI